MQSNTKQVKYSPFSKLQAGGANCKEKNILLCIDCKCIKLRENLFGLISYLLCVMLKTITLFLTWCRIGKVKLAYAFCGGHAREQRLSTRIIRLGANIRI